MKFFISKILLINLILITIIECRQVRRSRLSSLYVSVKDIKSRNPHSEDEFKLYNSFNLKCAENFLKYPESDQIFINELEEKVFKLAVILKCSDEDTAFTFLLDSYAPSMFSDYIKCFEWNLQQLDSGTKFIQNFTISDIEAAACQKRFPVDKLEKTQARIEKYFGSLNIFSCGAVTGVNDFIKFISKAVLVKFGDYNEEFKATEMIKLKEYLKNIVFTTVECILDRLEMDPVAFHINDTLSHYLEEALNPSEGDEPLPKFDIARKIFNGIDSNCLKEQLNFPKNQNIKLLAVESKILIGSAMLKCLKISKYDFSNLLLAYMINEHDKAEKYVYCSKYHLKDIEPDSKLTKIATINLNIERKFCGYFKEMSIYPISSTIDRYEDSVGDLKDSACGTISKNFIKSVTFKILLLAVEDDEELKKSEIESLFDASSDKLSNFADCVLQRVK